LDEFGRKRDEKRRNKPGIGVEPTAVKPLEEEQNKHFDAAEFRKREMVFQPKKKKGLLARPAMQTQLTTPKASKRIVKINNTMKVADLAQEMGLKSTELIRKLMKDGVMASINTELDFDTIALTVPEFGFEAVNAFKTAEEILATESEALPDTDAVTRPPVVTIMGHVDHGKTSLLDAIRNANVAAGEAGGITQHIGAYQVKTEGGHTITFLDTPGHEAFTAMRARGANVTDIVVVVVAADDGVMPQTAEAISHAKAAGVPMIVAVNKMDKPGANPDRIKQQLTEYEVVPEEWGGTTIFVPVSAVKKTGIKELLEQIHLLAEVGEFKANPQKLGSGSVIESKLEKGRGNVATILVKEGTVKVGQYIVAGTVPGRVKSLTNDKGEKVTEAGPGTPVEVLGLSGTPLAGDRFDVVKDETVIEDVIRVRKEQADKANAPSTKISLEDIFSKVKQGDVKELAVILKTDVSGSLEAVNGMFKKLSTPEVKLKVVHSAVGGITESDVLLAQTAKGIVVGFNVRPDGGATTASKRMGVEIRTYTIVYELIDEIKKAMAGLLAPTIVEKVLGRAEVRNTFVVPKVGTIAGCFVADGKVTRNGMARLIRDGKIIYEGKVSSLKRFKDDAREVAQGFECGIGIENFNDIKVGDSIESFMKEEVARELSPAPAGV
jgi:translation initiation factor IF-2